MTRPLVSVLMTAYNREKYIAEAIESVIAQTYQNWELIITDDQSKDQTVAIAKKYADKDERIKLYVNEQNLGDYPNRNRAASYAKGKYIKYLDADDLMYPWCLSVMLQVIETTETKWVLMQPEYGNRPFPFVLSPYEAYKEHFWGCPILARSPMSAMFDREAFWSCGGFTGKQHLGDFEFFMIMARQYPLTVMPRGMAWYRVHSDQQMNDNRNDPYVPFKYLAIRIELLNHEDCPLKNDERKKAILKTKRAMARSILKTIIRMDFKNSKKMMRLCGFGVRDMARYVM